MLKTVKLFWPDNYTHFLKAYYKKDNGWKEKKTKHLG